MPRWIVVLVLLAGTVSAAEFEERMQALESRIVELERGQEPEQELSLEELLAGMRPETGPVALSPVSAPTGLQSFNPDMSLVFLGLFNADSPSGSSQRLLERIDGFETQEPQAFRRGFQLQEVELALWADVDPFFRFYASLFLEEEDAGLEEAFFRTTALPYGLQVKGGKFFSEFARSNWMHPHDWDFADRSLPSNLIFGEEGLNQLGVQVSWLAPTTFHLLLGAEFLQGDNEEMFQYIGREGDLRSHAGPRLMVQWAKFSPLLPGDHEAEIGLFHGYGRHQAEWEQGRGALAGYSRFFGADFVYKYDAPKAHGHQDLTLQGEYVYRQRDTRLRSVSNPADAVHLGRTRLDEQDGFSLQGVYGFAPQWRTGLRFEQVGLLNRARHPDRARERFGASHRVAAMLDYSPSDFSRFRLQMSRGEFQVEGRHHEVYQVLLQVDLTLGVHGAHRF